MEGEVLLGGVAMEYLRPSLIKAYRASGFDFILIENQHAMLQGPALGDFILSARDNSMPIVCKVGNLDRTEIARLLDAGALGIQLSRTEAREQLQELIRYMKFPPDGIRTAAPCFGNVDYECPADDRRWLQEANAAVVVIAQIQTLKGYRNAEQIITTPGLDILYVDPYDLSIELGQPGDCDHSDARGPMEHMLELCHKHGIAFGTTPNNPSAGLEWMEKGCRFFEIVDEISLIKAAGREVVDVYRSHLPASPSKPHCA